MNINISIFLGNAWEAFSAIGTVSAVVVALWQINKQTDERNRDLEKEQASKVSGWLEGKNSDILEKEEKGKNVNAVLDNANIRNYSDLPIYNVYLLSSNMKSNDDLMTMSITHYVHFDIIPPGDKNITVGTAGSGGGDRSALVLLFVDSKGVIWFRTTKGGLIKMDRKTLNEFLKIRNIPLGPYGDGTICSLNYNNA